MKKKVRQKLPFFAFAFSLAVVLTAVLWFYGHSWESNPGQISIGEKPKNLVVTEDWLSFTTDAAPFTFSYPTTWGIEAIEANEERQGVHVIGPEGEIFMYWGGGFGGACGTDLKELKLKDENLKVCNVMLNGREEWGLIGKQISPTVGFDARASANQPTEKNREMILTIFSTLSFKK